MMRFAYLFAGGAAYFPGLAGCLIGLGIACFAQRPWLLATGRIMAVLGAVLLLLSAVPQPIALYAAWAGLLSLALLNKTSENPPRRRWRDGILIACVILTLVLGGMELPYRASPAIPFKPGGIMYEIGDSLSMGADTLDGNWPALLAAKADMEVTSFAFGGAKLGTSLTNAQRVKPDASLIIIELGGNDLFYDTPASEFADDLETILAELKQHGAPIVLLELPLPPFYNRLGTAQRRLADECEVILVPRHVLASVLATPGATIDGLHLAPQGHRLLAERLWKLRAADHH